MYMLFHKFFFGESIKNVIILAEKKQLIGNRFYSV